MCGISGIYNFDNSNVEENDIRLMMSKMVHRGPDDNGIYIKDHLGFGFVRLSILDLSLAGHQPMFSDDNRFVIVFNGEVFNYLEIRRELKTKVTFKTGTDTEVVLAAFQEWGKECLGKLNGMFAFVIYDTISGEVFGARDRYGIKPLYYFKDENRFVFASEIKSILPLLSRKEVNNDVIYNYLLFNRTDYGPDTFFKGIRKIRHGQYFVIKNGDFSIHTWYNLKDRIGKHKFLSSTDYRTLFRDSIKLRLRSDVPIGVSLSGGIDSSSVVSCLMEDFEMKELMTFSAVFDKNEDSDESEYVDEYKSIVKNMFFTTPDAKSFFNDFDRFIEAHNEPIADTGPYIQFKVMELASENVTVTLDGQGADEQLAGYHYFFGSYFIELLRNFKLITFIKENISYFRKHRSLDAFKFFIYYLLPARFQNIASNNLYPSINKNFLKKYKSSNELNNKLYNPKDLNDLLLKHFEYKLEHLLKWEDLNSMCFSIESRVPFLDYRLVESTLSTPSEQKINDGETKHLLREAMRDILPFKITNRKDKKGFTNPREKWFRTEEFQVFVFDLLNSESFKSRGYFDSKKAILQYKKHLSGKSDLSREIWKWINLELWFRKYID